MVIVGYLFSTPPGYFFSKTQLFQHVTLEHQALSCFERALHLIPASSNLSALAWKLVFSWLQKDPSWRSICISAEPLPILVWAINFVFSNPPSGHQSSSQYYHSCQTTLALAHPFVNAVECGFSFSFRHQCLDWWICSFLFWTGWC